MRTAVFVAVLFTLVQLQASAGTVVYHSFNASNTVADIGPSLSTFSHQNATGASVTFVAWGSGSGQNLQLGYLAGTAIKQNNWQGNTNYFQFTFDATAYSDIVVSYVFQRSATGPTNAIFQYSTTGLSGTFVDFATNAVPSGTFTGGLCTQDLTSVSVLNGDANVTLRIVGIDVGSTVGTLTLDNFTIDAIPEPATTLLLGAGLAGLLVLRRRHH